MSDIEDAPQYQWVNASDPTAEEPETAAFVAKPGPAKVTYPNGDTFEGSFNDDRQKHGHGIYTWSSAPGANPWVPPVDEDAEEDADSGFPSDRVVRYDGDYVDGKKHGVGKVTYPTGDRYHGEWQADKKHGEGTYFYINGDIYSGSWQDDKRQGQGAFVFAKDRSQLVGEWEDGQLQSGQWLFKDGTSWHGHFKNNRPIGPGVFVFPNGNSQFGKYVEIVDEEDEEAEPQLLWKAEKTVPTGADAADVTRV